MAWYIPLTIIPGVALIILSTSNFTIALNAEISQMKKENSEINKSIIKQKLNQLTKLSIAISCQYLGLSGVMCVSLSILILIFYSFKALFIRRAHLAAE